MLPILRLGMLSGAIIALVSPLRAADNHLPDQPQIGTLAGSGTIGFADGSPVSASFVAPVGLHYGPDGSLYVADRGAQRIRRIARDGFVTTLAGSGSLIPIGTGVAGGFADGPATSARFRDPEDVIALPNGVVLVADTGNACLRAIEAGRVRTFAGRCGEPGATNGDLASARFTRPHSLTVAANGDIYVVDAPNGIRRISGASVTTIVSPHSQDAIAIAATSKPVPTLLVAAATLVDAIDPVSGAVRTELSLESTPIGGSILAGSYRGGPATGIAPVDANDYVLTDPLDDHVILVQVEAVKGSGGGSYLRTLGADPPYEALVDGQIFRDGSAGTALFSEPTSVAIAPDGRMAVADLGSRRVRLIAPFGHDSHTRRVNDGTELPAVPDPGVVRIALLGNSYLWTLQGWDDSIGGEVEHLVNAALPPTAKRVEVYPIMRQGASTIDLLSFANEELADGVVDDVVVSVADRGQFPTRAGNHVAGDFDSGWIDRTRAALSATRAHLAAGHVGFFALLHPGTDDFQDETEYLHVDKAAMVNDPRVAPLADPAQAQQSRDDVLAAVAVPGLDVIDCWPAFLAAHAAPRHAPLFMELDNHLSTYGRSVVARAMANDLLRALAPKASSSGSR